MVSNCRSWLVCVLFLVGAASASAQNSLSVNLNIDSQPLPAALNQWAAQTGYMVLVPTQDGAQSLIAPRIQGAYTPEEGLKLLLEKSGYTYEVVSARTVNIRPIKEKRKQTSATNAPSAHDANIENIRVTQVDQSAAGPQAAGSDQSTEKKKKEEGLTEIVVTGTHLPIPASEQPLPIRSYSAETIANSGQTTIVDFLNTMPDVSTSTSSPLIGGIPGSSTVTLHGLPVGTTLTLLNGRRVETSYYRFFDLNNIPASAVERIDVLPVGASAIYGADALGGAVNIITRRSIDGLDVGVSENHFSGAHDTNVHLGWGTHTDRSAILLLGSFQDSTELLGDQRALTSTTTAPASVAPLYIFDDCSPGNVYSLDGSNLPGLNSPQAAIPKNVQGKPTLTQLAAGAGNTNLCNLNRSYSLVPAERRASLLLSGDIELTPNIDLFTETMATHSDVTSSGPYGLRIDAQGGSFGAVTLGATNPYNPFGEDVGISFSFNAPRQTQIIGETFFRPLIGVRGELFSDWHYELSAYLSQDKINVDENGTANSDALQAALNSSNPATALNPFASQVLSLSSLPAGFFDPDQHFHFDNRVIAGQANIHGTLWTLPSGTVETVVGGEYRKEDQDSAAPFLPQDQNLQRRTYAVYTEMRLPLLGQAWDLGTGQALFANLAARYDHTDDFGGKGTWQGGLTWKPIRQLTVSGTYGLSYRAPQLQEIGGASRVLVNRNFGFIDPFRNNEPIRSDLVSGPNPLLAPETGRSTTFSIAYRAEEAQGAQADLTFFKIHIDDFIGSPDGQTIIDNPSLFPTGVTRAAPTAADISQGLPGKITSIDSTYFNFGRLDVSGVDVDLSYGIPTPVGRFTPSIAVSNVFKWQSAISPHAPALDYVSNANLSGTGWAPRWKGTAGFAWNWKELSANISERYVGRYLDYQEFAPNTNELGNAWFCDLNVRYEFGQAALKALGSVQKISISAGATDLFNRSIPFSYGVTPYDPFVYDIRGRMFFAQVGVKW
jgi:iron complex outermembrane recepter protein